MDISCNSTESTVNSIFPNGRMSDLKKKFFMINKIDFTWELWHEIRKRLSMKNYEQLALNKTDVCDD